MGIPPLVLGLFGGVDAPTFAGSLTGSAKAVSRFPGSREGAHEV
jgi:hypothetical protein